jgi:hypothetical protein
VHSLPVSVCSVPTAFSLVIRSGRDVSYDRGIVKDVPSLANVPISGFIEVVVDRKVAER